MNMLKRFWSDRRGATAIEYALIASLIGLTLIGGATVIGSELSGTFADVAAGF